MPFNCLQKPFKCLAKNFEKMKDFLQKLPQKLNVVCISETRTNVTNLKLTNLPGYHFYYNNFATRAGGSGIFVPKSLPSKELVDLCMNMLDCEDVWVEISTGKIDTIVIPSIYQHLKQSID